MRGELKNETEEDSIQRNQCEQREEIIHVVLELTSILHSRAQI